MSEWQLRRTLDNLFDVSYADDGALKRWPMERAANRRQQTIMVLRPDDVFLRREGKADPTLVGILASTEHLTVGTMELRWPAH